MSVQHSLVLVGRRGSGLSSFAVIAARLTGFTIIDIDALFVSEHRTSRAACLRAWGEQHYRDLAARFVTNVITQHKENHVLICASEAAGSNAQSLAQACGHDIPIIMINRDTDAVQCHLSLSDSDETERILFATQQLCRKAANVEFYNLAEEQGPQAVAETIQRAFRSDQSPPQRVRRLQNVTQDVHCFLSLLGYRIGGDVGSRIPDTLGTREFASYTTLCFEDILGRPIDMLGWHCASDALELSVTVPEVQSHIQEDVEHICEAFQLLRRHYQLPIIHHVEWPSDSSLAAISRYEDLSKQGLRLLPQYATIDLRCTDQGIISFVAASRDCTKIIAHITFSTQIEFSWKDPLLIEQCRRAADLGCHHVRFVRHAISPLEDRECATFQTIASSVSGIPVSAVNIDRYARSSAVHNTGLTAVSQPRLRFSEHGAPLPTAQELTRARFSSFVFHPLHFYIFGASVDYSMSPAMHNVAFETLGMDHHYLPRQSNSLESIKYLFDDTFGGASISLPFKSTVISLLDTISEHARIIRAVNTIIPRRGGSTGEGQTSAVPNGTKNRAGPITALHGDNTDWMALRTCILRQLSAANSVNASTTALVVGAGGMASATVYALLKLGVKNIVIWNRTSSRTEILVGNYAEYVSSPAAPTMSRATKFIILDSLDAPWPNDLKQPSIVVCTPPAHFTGGKPGLDFKLPEQWFQSTTGGVIVELSYKSRSTSLLRQAYENAHRGWVVVEPLELLIEQGCAQFELFTGRPAPRNQMTRSVIDSY